MITAIVPVWNGRELLSRLLDTLDAQSVPAGELLVVDNGSTDGAPELARNRGARIIAMGRNAGFAVAVNRGIREARGEHVAILNSDVELAPDYFAILSHTDAWFATGKILRYSSTHIDGTFDAVCRGGAAWRVGAGRLDGPLFSSPRPIDSPPWTAVMFRAEMFQRVGYLEESFESYLEDVDFGLRAAAHGLAGVYLPHAVAWHRGSAALGVWHPDTVRHISRNQVLLLARHYPGPLLLRWSWPIVVAHLLWGAVAFRHASGLAWLRGKLEGLRRFRSARHGAVFTTRLADHLRANEAMIHEAQAAAGFDSYWKWYFLLTGGGK
jgi:GT2 family glycosyltransferase